MSEQRDRSEGMSTLGPYQDPAVREWFDSLPNPDYWENCRRMGEESLARARAEHAAQRGD
uniref:Uncharacterized protein n=1 Tax=Brevibacterium sp. Ap13 TaxID=1406197 RepID=U5NZ64_9MICO|nr:hypothetical protein AP13_p00250 [Brevibacterium sp. Ap13]